MAFTTYQRDSISQVAQIGGFLTDKFAPLMLIFTEWAPDDALLETITQEQLDEVFGEGVVNVQYLKDVVYWLNTELKPALEADDNALLTKMNHVRRAF
jgi:hypothetical protein